MKWDIAQIMRNNKREEGEPKGTIDIKLELWDHLRVKSSLTYGDGGPIVDICGRHKDEFKASDIYTLMFNMKLYEIAYRKLKSNPGNMQGIDEVTLDGISKEVFQEIIKAMKDESFQFKRRRTHIPKSNGKTRPLTIAPARDKIVQEVMRMILEAIFEPTFSDNSHGFRPNRSCQTALRQVKTQFNGASFFIEGDISKCLDSFDQRHLMEQIKRRINDERFIRLIWKTLKAGYLFNRTKLSIIGSPQGSIIRPLLSNIYLNELDNFIAELKVEFDKGVRAKVSSEYKHLDYLRQRALKNKDQREAFLLLKAMQKRKAFDHNYRRLYYVRYADE
ncbi:putative 91 kDa protein in cob intron [Golovinomyces cichoracearum]|uniref:Putative 91 kDa protein in cob intron n=1 Tax=Golovinomyces cichoracearum TaxID=62708 RepID=A0A420IAI9_9PEZI|nr:putative 91 kDa protein in cob intron [Golovinomyces cichoracearum]RKF71570.1 putative 91 kDa protein in cob intron [Golovinomyces cichoracearum]